MSGPEFFQTPMGRAFFEATMPGLVGALKAIAEHLSRGSIVAAEEAQQRAENEFWEKAYLASLQTVVGGSTFHQKCAKEATSFADAALEEWRGRAAKLKAIPA